MDISEYVFQVPFNPSAAPLSQLLTLLSSHIPTPLEGTELLPVITGGRLVYRVWPLPQALSPAEAREDGLVANTLTHGHGTLATFTQKGGRLHVAVGCIFILSLAQGGGTPTSSARRAFGFVHVSSSETVAIHARDKLLLFGSTFKAGFDH